MSTVGLTAYIDRKHAVFRHMAAIGDEAMPKIECVN